MLGRLISLLSLGGTVASVTMLQRFLAGLTEVIAFTIVSALMASVLLLGGFIGLYFGLTHAGLEPLAAILCVGGLVLAIAAICAWAAVAKLKKLKELPFSTSHGDLPSLDKLTGIVKAFFDGLSAGRALRAQRDTHRSRDSYRQYDEKVREFRRP